MTTEPETPKAFSDYIEDIVARKGPLGPVDLSNLPKGVEVSQESSYLVNKDHLIQPYKVIVDGMEIDAFALPDSSCLKMKWRANGQKLSLPYLENLVFAQLPLALFSGPDPLDEEQRRAFSSIEIQTSNFRDKFIFGFSPITFTNYDKERDKVDFEDIQKAIFTTKFDKNRKYGIGAWREFKNLCILQLELPDIASERISPALLELLLETHMYAESGQIFESAEKASEALRRIF